MVPLITLTTDFGTRDPYVAAMKGVLLRRCPGATLVDLSHDLSPYHVVEAALFLAASVPYFPPGTVHVVVVDPGVGTSRRPIGARVAEQVLVGPDNGLLTLLWREHGRGAVHEIIEVTPPGEVSATFHGRDVFAPAAALLAGGAVLEALGPPFADAVRLDVPEPRFVDGAWLAEVIHADRFGNAVTNLHRRHLGDAERLEARVAGRAVPFHHTYGDAPAGAPLALFGSAGYLEVAVSRGDAARELGLKRGDGVEIHVAPA